MLAYLGCAGQGYVRVRYTSELPYGEYGWLRGACRDSVVCDSVGGLGWLSGCVSSLRGAGYLEASVDSVWRDGSGGVVVGLHLGAPYVVESVSGVDGMQVGEGVSGAWLTPWRVAELAGEVSAHLPDNALVRVGVRGGGDLGRVRLELGVDSLLRGPVVGVVLGGGVRMRPGVLMRLLGLGYGDSVDWSSLSGLARRAAGLSVVRLAGPLELEWVEGGVLLHAVLVRRLSSSVSGHVALGGGVDGYALGGHFRGVLHGVLGYAERFEFDWRGARGGDHAVRVVAEWPYVWGSCWGVEGRVGLHRGVGGVGMLDLWGGVSYALSARHRVYVGQQYLSGRNRMGAQSRAYLSHLGWGLEVLDYGGGWDDGLSVVCELGMGRRVAGFGVGGVAMRYRVRGRWVRALGDRGFWLGGRWVGGGYFPLYRGVVLGEEELLRYGGAGSLRGFHEDQLLAQHYGVLSLEPGWGVGEWVRVALLVDGSWRAWAGEQDWLVGYGGWLAVRLGMGDFRVGMAWGRGLSGQGGGVGLVHMDLGLRF